MTILNFIEFGLTYLFAIMIPGPSIALIISNSILHSRLASIITCLGVVVGIAVQSGIILIGLSFIENNSVFLKCIKIMCSIYLIYLGIRILLLKKLKAKQKTNILSNIVNSEAKSFFFQGFLVEFLNPLAFTFFFSVMSVELEFNQFWSVKFIYWLEIVILGFLWFFTLVLITSSDKFTLYTKKFNNILETLAGCMFIAFGSKFFI